METRDLFPTDLENLEDLYEAVRFADCDREGAGNQRCRLAGFFGTLRRNAAAKSVSLKEFSK